jgi:hypothetical protein
MCPGKAENKKLRADPEVKNQGSPFKLKDKNGINYIFNYPIM